MPGRRDVIEEQGGKFVLLSHEGKKLGEHPTKAAAEQQENAVNIAKARAAGHRIPRPDSYDGYAAEVLGPKVKAISPDGGSVGWYDMSVEHQHMTMPDAVDQLRGDEETPQVCWMCGETCASTQCQCASCTCPACEEYDCADRMAAKESAPAGDDMPRIEIIPARADAEPRREKDQLRIDLAELRPAMQMENGYLRCDGAFTRTGVFRYTNPDGTERREYRPPEEVFAPESLKSFGMVPVTDEHPPVFLNSTNTSRYQKGHTGENVRRSDDGDFMVGPIVVTDADLVKKIKDGKRELSNGYTVDLEWTPGVSPDGERYDAVQRNIRGNHLAFVEAARAGENARVRVDSASGAVIGLGPVHPNAPEGTVADKIKIGGITYDAGSTQAAEAIAQQVERLDSERKSFEKQRTDAATAAADEKKRTDAALKAAQDAMEKEKARADAAEEKLKAAQAELKAAPEKISAQLRERMKLEATAGRILAACARADGAGEKEAAKLARKVMDGKSDREIKVAVLGKTNESLNLKDRPDAYVDARFDSAVEQFEEDEAAGEGDKRADGAEVLTDPGEGDGSEERADGAESEEDDEDADERLKRKDAVGARARMEKRNREAWQKPLKPGELAS